MRCCFGDFLSENPDNLCSRVGLKIQEEQGGIGTKTIDDEIFARIDELLEHKPVTKAQHKTVFNQLQIKIKIKSLGYLENVQ